HGLGWGGTMIDFGLHFHHCSLSELLVILNGWKEQSFFFHPPFSSPKKGSQEKGTRLEIVRSEPLVNDSLLAYVSQRGISHQIAKKYLEQISFRTNEKEFLAFGFKNNSGGYELRNERFKGSCSPKDSTLIQGDKNSDTLAVFEGMFSFLSYLELQENERIQLQKKSADTDPMFSNTASHFLILNSLAFLEKRREMMELYSKIILYLDRDKAGMEATQKVLHWSEKYNDKSTLYIGHKDLNDYLVHLKKQQLQPEKRKRKGSKRTV
ncbi:MAG: hypothetical protein EOO10_19025, partial [Chitinophagaceae bacterium]